MSKILLLGLSRDDDDFTQVVRKVTVVTHFLCSPAALAFAVYWLLLYNSGDGTLGVLIAGVCGVVFFLPPCLSSYFFVRRNRKVASDGLMTWMLGWVAIGTLILSLSVPSWPIVWQATATLLLTAMSKPVASPLIGLIVIVSQLVSATNQVYSAAEGGSEFLISFADPHNPQLTERILHAVTSFSILSLGIVGVVAQALTYRRLDDESQASLLMASAVANQLEMYNTDAVAQLLDGDHGSDNSTTAMLAASFRSLAKNLDAYRVYLPNYMFHAAFRRQQEADENEMDEDDLSSIDETVVRTDAVRTPDPALFSITSNIVGDSPEELQLQSVSSKDSSSQGPSTNRSKASHRSFVTSLSNREHPVDVGEVKLGCSGLDGTTIRQTKSFRTPAKAPEGVVFCGTVSYMVVDFREISMKSKHEVRANHHGELQTFVNQLFETANDTKGAIHSLVGDVLFCSWNATNTVAQPEVKAAQCLSRIAKSSKKSGIPVPGVVCSGTAIVSTFPTTTRSQALLIHLPWQGRVDGNLRLARQYSTMIADTQTQSVAGYSCSFRPVEIGVYKDDARDPFVGFMCDSVNPVSREKANELHHSLVFELLEETLHNEDEWMYQLQKKEADEALHQALTAVFDAIFIGDILLARNNFSDLSLALTDSDALLHRLSNFLEKA